MAYEPAGTFLLKGGDTLTGNFSLGGYQFAYDAAATHYTQWDATNSRVVHSGTYYRFGALGNSIDIFPYNASVAKPNRLSATYNNTYTTDSALWSLSATVNHATASSTGALLATRSLRTTYTSTSPNNLLWSDFVGITSSANNNANSVVARYCQSVRSGVQTGGTIGCAQWCDVMELRSQTNLPSSQDGILQTLELDMFCGGLDDKPGRTILTMVVARNQLSDTAPQVANGITIYPFAGAIGAGSTMGRCYSSNIPFYQSCFDSRSATQMTGANALWLGDAQTIAFDTAGTRLLYSDTTDGELRYSKSGSPVFAIKDDGSTTDSRFRNGVRNPLFNIHQNGVGPWTAGPSAYAAIVDGWGYVGTAGGTRTITVAALSDADRTAIGNQEAYFCLSYVFTGGSGASDREVLTQTIPNVRAYAGRTVTVAFDAVAASGTPLVGIEIVQNFGTGGSPSGAVNTINGTVQTLSTTWGRYQTQVVVPSIAGKTLGTNNDSNTTINLWISQGSSYSARGGTVGVQSATIRFWDIEIVRSLFAPPREVRPDDVEVSLLTAPKQIVSVSAGGTPGPFLVPTTMGINNVTSVASGTYVELPGYGTSTSVVDCTIINSTTSTINVMPPAGGTIAGGSANTAVTMAAGTRRTFSSTSSLTWF